MPYARTVVAQVCGQPVGDAINSGKSSLTFSTRGEAGVFVYSFVFLFASPRQLRSITESVSTYILHRSLYEFTVKQLGLPLNEWVVSSLGHQIKLKSAMKLYVGVRACCSWYEMCFLLTAIAQMWSIRKKQKTKMKIKKTEKTNSEPTNPQNRPIKRF